MSSNFEQARDFFLRGVNRYEAGDLLQAERDFAASLALLPGRPSTLTNLGAVRLKLGRADEAAAVLEEALAQEPDNAEALRHHAAALAELDQHERALAAIDRALRVQPTPAAWTLRGSILRSLGRASEAAAAYRTAAEQGGDNELNRFFLASLGGDRPPAHAPREYVESLFDGYAGEFESHLVEVLNYRAPQRLVERLGPAPVDAALDLGCGTGLCGPLLRPQARRLVAVDLSGNMVERARATGSYDEVVQADAVEFLRDHGAAFDLLVAADVLVYVGSLQELFAAAGRALRPGGRFCFTVELAPPGGSELVLQPSMRYAHTAAYVRAQAQQAGFDISATEEQPIREDQGRPIPGLFVWLVRR